MSTSRRVGVVGLGRMGLGLARSFRRARYSVVGTDRTTERRVEAESHGITTVASLDALAATCDIVVTALPDGPDVEDVALGVATAAKTGTLVLDASTIDPDVSRSVAAQLKAHGLRFADAAMAGSPDDAASGRVLFLVGSVPADFPEVEAILTPIGRGVVNCGGIGAGVALKVVNNALAVAVFLADVEALALAGRAGLDPAVTLAVLRQTVAANRGLDTLVPALLARRLEGGFRVALARKDVALAAGLARRLGAPHAAALMAVGHLTRALDEGLGDLAVAAAGIPIERDAGIDLTSAAHSEVAP